MPERGHMNPADLNMTTQVLGHGRSLFIRLPHDRVDATLATAIDGLRAGMENMQNVDGSPSEENFRMGRFQLLRAELGFSQEKDLLHPAMSMASFLIQLESAYPEPL
jgi:hypothetical protein